MYQTHPPASGQCPMRPPVPPPAGPLPIHGPDFDRDPHATYQRLRAQGPIAPVEISPRVPDVPGSSPVYGYLVVSYWSALYILRNTPDLFAKDSRLHWAALRDGQVPADSPARMMMQPRDNALWKDGEEHQRLRGAITSALARVDTYDLAAAITRIADELMDVFIADGQADLVSQFAEPLPMMTVTALFAAPPKIGSRIVQHVTTLFAAGPDAAKANALLEAACLELVHVKRSRPGRDVVTSLIQAGLTDPELVQTLVLLFGAAAPPAAKAIGRTTQRYLTDAHLARHVHTGVLPVAAALESVLWDDPPVANYSPLFARSPMTIHGAQVQPGYPILISFAAANSDPALGGLAPAARAGNRGHIAFSAGVHGCPAQGMGRLIVETAVERLLDRLSQLALAIADSDVPNIPGTFLAGPASLPVSFRPAAPAPGR
ncbi:cytochrome P450 [Streptomyces microflavus]|uniref:cytochrome P450 n=1 Tax=Streptomyces microflavus TaxID=1919 RepID=UPI00364B44C7